MFTKMWIGLYLSLVQVVMYIIVVINTDASSCDQEDLVSEYNWYSLSHRCFDLLLRNYSINCTLFKTFDDSTYLWFIIPHLLNGLSSLLVSMTVFEFICAQAPRTTQGLLIGLWYATFSIRYLVVGVLDLYITERHSWLICKGVKGFLILVSLVLFSCVSRHYHYR